MISAVKLLPETAKVCAADAVPYVVVKAVAVAVPVIVGPDVGVPPTHFRAKF